MKRLLSMAAALAAVALILLIGWPRVRERFFPGVDENGLAAAQAEGAAANGAATGALPLLPRPEGAGMSPAAAGTPGADPGMFSRPSFLDIFSTTTFVLNTPLPEGPARFNAYLQEPQPLTLERARDWAERLRVFGTALHVLLAGRNASAGRNCHCGWLWPGLSRL